MPNQESKTQIYSYREDGIEFTAFEDREVKTPDGMYQIYADFKIYDTAFMKKVNPNHKEKLLFETKISNTATNDEMQEMLRSAGMQIRKNQFGERAYLEYENCQIENDGYCKANMVRFFAYDTIHDKLLDMLNDMLVSASGVELESVFTLPAQLYSDEMIQLVQEEILPSLCGLHNNEAKVILPKLNDEKWMSENIDCISHELSLGLHISHLRDIFEDYETFEFDDKFDDDEDEYEDLSELKKKQEKKAEPKKSVGGGKQAEGTTEIKNIKELIDKKFEGLVGLTPIKKQLHKIVAYTVQNKNYTDLSLHMAFVGNPGTGKTTVAKVVAEILSEAGILDSKEIIVKSGAELQGKYLGETPHLVNDLIEEGMGKVVLIDEAYNLAEGHSDGGSDYKKEAISTLIAKMEEHRKDICIIFAGYTKEMEAFLDMNPGLRSRVPHKIEFKDFSHEEINTIFDNLVAMSEKTIDQDALDQAHESLGKLCNKKDFANARGVRNVFQSILYEQAMRIDTTDQNPNIMLDDVKNGILAFCQSSKHEEERRPIGFGPVEGRGLEKTLY